MEQVKKFSFDVGWVFFASVVSLLIGFPLKIILARWLGASDLGLYQMVVTVLAIAGLVSTLGIGVALTKYVAEDKKDKDKLSQIMTPGLLGPIILGLIAGISLYALSGMIAGIFNMPELAHLLRIIAFTLPVSAFVGALVGILNGLREMKTYSFLAILSSLLSIIFIVVFVKLGFGITGVIFGMLFSTIGAFIGGIYLSKNLLRLDIKNFIKNAKKLVSFGGRVFVGNTLSRLIQQADIIMIGYFLAAKDVGYYSIAVGLASFFLLVPRAIATITYPATSEYWSENNRTAIQRMVDKTTKYSAAILLPIGLGVGFFARDVVTGIYGEEFIYAVSPLWALLIGRVITGSIITPIAGSIGATGRPQFNVMLNAITLVANIGLNFLLIPRYGILGAAIATTVSFILWTILFHVLIVRILKVKIDFKWFSLAMGSACVAAILFLVGTKFINLYLAGGTILCAYIVLVLKFFLTKEDKTIFRSLSYSLILQIKPLARLLRSRRALK